MSPGNQDIDDEIIEHLTLEALIRRHTRLKRTEQALLDPVYLAAIDYSDVFGKKLDKALVEYGKKIYGN